MHLGIAKQSWGAGVSTLELIITIIWASTAGFGIYLLVAALTPASRATRITTFPATVVFAHPILASAGFTLWVMFLRTDRLSYAWSGFAVLSASAMLGFVLLTRWLVGHGGRHARGAGQRFPATVVAMHGAVGVTTFALVLVAATLATRRH